MNRCDVGLDLTVAELSELIISIFFFNTMQIKSTVQIIVNKKVNLIIFAHYNGLLISILFNQWSISSTILRAHFCTKVLSYFHQSQNITREKLCEVLLYKKGACKMLMKLTQSQPFVLEGHVSPFLCKLLW